MRTMSRLLGNERGVALPMAMIMLVVLTGMMAAFAVLGRSEPTIAANQQRMTQSLALADSGLQLAMWALSNPTHAMGLDPAVMPHNGSPISGRYDGTQFISVGGLGGFTVRVTWEPGNAAYERTVTAVGWTPSNANTRNAHRRIRAVVQQGYTPPLDPPCVLCVGGEVQVNGAAAAFNSSVGGCPGKTPPTTATQSVQAVDITGLPTFIGYGTTGEAARGIATDTSVFKYSSDSLLKFKQYAQSQGTYYRGTQTTLPSGPGPYIVFIDTTDGEEFTSSTPPGHEARLSLSGTGTFNGTVIVAGTANLSGTWVINGGVVSENRRDTSSTNVDTDISGSVAMTYDCSKIRNVPWSFNWVVKTGGYLEEQD